ncbi:MAG TPA: hypothetical protein VFW98_14885 [Gemmatimonadaceae bacterium]|nr:hypothetical protein [Gemmatimonadaceae bacterium]
MFRDRVILGLRSGVIAAAAIVGVLLGLGRAHDSTFRPLNAVAHVALGSRALLFDRLSLEVTLLGLILLVGALLVWGVLFAFVAASLRGIRLLIAGTLFTVVVYLVNAGLLPPRFRPGFELILSAAELAAVYIALAVALTAALMLSRALRNRA